MKRTLLKSVILSMTIGLVTGCLDPYTPSTSSANVNYLVVEGFFNANGTTEIRLSRTSPISSSHSIHREADAFVQIEGDDGSGYTLVNTGNGSYVLGPQPVDTTRQYRLRIKTSDQKEYASDFVPVRQAPPIDTIHYTLTGEDLQFYLSTHDDRGSSRYYFWNFVETWEFNSKFQSDYIFRNDSIIIRPSSTELYFCWSTLNSTDILINSSARLTRDEIHDFPVRLLNVHDKKLQIRYSILIQQYVLTREAYTYWDQLKKSTETNGTIFDPQPSQSPSNIHDVANSGTPVIGYFSAGSAASKRFFIKKEELPAVERITGYEACRPDTLMLSSVPLFDGSELIVTGIYNRATLLGYQIAYPPCVDCRYNNGTTVRPDFW